MKTEKPETDFRGDFNGTAAHAAPTVVGAKELFLIVTTAVSFLILVFLCAPDFFN